MLFRWASLEWGLLCHRSYFFRLLNPFLLCLLTPPALVIYFVGGLLSLLQARAFFGFALMALLFLDYDKLSWKVRLGCLLWSALSLLYFIYTVINSNQFGLTESLGSKITEDVENVIGGRIC